MRLINSVIIMHVYILIFILSFSIFVYINIVRLNLSHSQETWDDKKMNANPKNWSTSRHDLITMDVRGAIQKFVDKCKEINNNHWIRLKIYEYKF